ncbi:hypothetical protein PIB30_013944 [Stylosanthes scabra]|uniref:Replication protein A 70 kDa DNA-binding subunit B/D first OB fold domain-containing protein n=1 Tax=Stylosanthes scabra TaxID=79078 RepID=A0ABU6W608_9FABA|nr:hypothetical protein [Stylosanthes scabra]
MSQASQMGTELTALTTKRSQWVLKVWLVRMWEGPPKGDSSQAGAWEMLFHDFKGNRVHCTLCLGVITTFKPILSEGQFYSLSNFLVVKNRLWMKSSPLEYRIILMQRSRVLLISQSLFPFKSFVFRSIASVLNEEPLQENVLFDPKEMVTKQGTNSKRIELRVEDTDKTSISCTLFGGLVDCIKPYIEEEKGEPLIVALQLFRFKEWNGKISIQSNFETSNIHINPQCPKADMFRNSILDTMQGKSGLSSARISHIGGKSNRSAVEDLRGGIVAVESIEDVMNAQEPGNKWIACEVEDFDVGNTIGASLAVGLRNKLFAYVNDHSGSMCVVFWDTEATQIIGLNVEKVRSLNKEGDNDSYPSVFKKALKKKVLLRITIKSANISGSEYVYNVSKASLDQHLIKKHFIKQKEAVGESHVVVCRWRTLLLALVLLLILSLLVAWTQFHLSRSSSTSRRQLPAPRQKGRRLDSGVVGEVANNLEEIPLGQLSTTKMARVSTKKDKNN